MDKTQKNFQTLVVGGAYRNHKGKKVKIMRMEDETHFPAFTYHGDDGKMYMMDGTLWGVAGSFSDLVELISLPETEKAQNLTELAAEFTEWSLPTFKGATAEVSLQKLKGEIMELEHELWLHNTEEAADEYADCLMCLFDSAARAGHTPEKLAQAFAEKLKVNKARTWARNEDGTYSHVNPTNP